MNTKVIIVGIIILVAAGGYYFFMQKKSLPVSPLSNTPLTHSVESPTPSPTPTVIDANSNLKEELEKLTPEENTKAFTDLNAQIDKL